MSIKTTIRGLFEQGLSNQEIGDKVNLAKNTVSYHLNSMGLSQMKIDKSDFKTLYDSGLNDVEIGKRTQCSAETVRRWRLENNLNSNFSYRDTRKFNYVDIETMVRKEKTDKEIAKHFNVSESSIYRARKMLKLNRRPLSEGSELDLQKKDLELLVGCLLGDGSLYLRDCAKNPFFSCEHGKKQVGYAKYKFEQLKHLGFKYFEYTRNKVDERTGIKYHSASVRSSSSPSLLNLYYAFYPNGTKVIPRETIKQYYTAYAMAIHYMDDGSKAGEYGYLLYTTCFTREDIDYFRDFMFKTFDLKTNYRKCSNAIYVPAKSKQRFKDLVSPYIIDSMRYKL